MVVSVPWVAGVMQAPRATQVSRYQRLVRGVEFQMLHLEVV